MSLDSSIAEAFVFSVIFVVQSLGSDPDYKFNWGIFAIGTLIGLILHLKSLTISTSISWGPAGPVTALTQTQNIYLAFYGVLFDGSVLNGMQVGGIIVGIVGAVIICVEKASALILAIFKRMC